MSLKRIEKKLQALEDIENIKKLKARYCYYCDDKYDADGIANLFAEDGIWDGGRLFGRHKGRRAVKRFFQKASKKITFAVHTVMTPVIEVQGDKAKGSWYLLQASTMKKGNQPVWGAARYDERYVKIKGRWKFKQLKVTFFYWTPYELGWAKKRIIS